MYCTGVAIGPSLFLGSHRPFPIFAPYGGLCTVETELTVKTTAYKLSFHICIASCCPLWRISYTSLYVYDFVIFLTLPPVEDFSFDIYFSENHLPLRSGNRVNDKNHCI